MRKIVAAVIIGVFCVSSIPAQQQQQAVPDTNRYSGNRIPNGDLISAQLERSYISFSKGLGNLPREIMEAQVALHLPAFISQRPPDSRGGRWIRGAIVSFEPGLRMLAVHSEPVRTPSYKIGGSLFFKRPFGPHGELLELRVFHYSNGQEGEAIRNGRVNYANGSFSQLVATTLGWSKAIGGANWLQVVRATTDVYLSPDSLSKADYGRTRFSAQWLFLRRQGGFTGSEGGLDVRLWFSPEGIHRDGVNHFDFQATLMGHGLKLGNTLGWFVGACWGRDYYNINYQRGNVSSIRAGIMAVGRDYNLSVRP
ncbi:MAG TPA: hypothetical protein VE967_09130 [Gemmatimonadaceae bacterium]|nr:hypothetical protein [Gemmatimonadaceae bacterium]